MFNILNLCFSVPNYSDIQSCIEIVQDDNRNKINENALFDEVTVLKSYISTNNYKILEWKKNKIHFSDRWVEVFNFFMQNNHQYKNILLLVEFSQCLPGTNAQVERVFSHMNNIWTSEKTQLKVETLKSLIITKLNFNFGCSEFYNMLLENADVLEAIHSSKNMYINVNKRMYLNYIVKVVYSSVTFQNTFCFLLYRLCVFYVILN